MSQVITFGNKGGSAGKTTTAVTLAALLGETGKRVLFVDADPQTNATYSLGLKAQRGLTIGDVMLGRASIADVIIDTTTAPGVALVPSWPGLSTDILTLASTVGSEQRFARALDLVKNDFDVIIVDSPGGEQTMGVATLVAADVAISVTKLGRKEVQGVSDFIQLVDEVATAYRPGLSTVAVVPCDVPPRNAGAFYRDVIEFMAQLPWAQLITPPARHAVRVPESYAMGVPLTHERFRNEQITADYRVILDWLVARSVI